MKGISLWNPWAILICAGEKKIETRRWRPKVASGNEYFGEIAIIATLNFPDHARLICKLSPFRQALKRIFNFKGGDDGMIKLLPLGAIVGTAEVYKYERTENVDKKLAGLKEIHFGDYAPGRWAWHLRNPQLLKNPVPCKGKMTAWDLPEDLEKLVREQIR